MNLETCPFLVLGASTDVGKTLFCRLVRDEVLSLRGSDPEQNGTAQPIGFRYLKPVQTGFPDHCDAAFVANQSSTQEVETGWTYEAPLSPHFCARNEGRVVSDEQLCERIREWALMCSRAEGAGDECLAFVEGAGGVLSPMPSGTPTLDALRPLRLPVILLGSTRLGGISESLCALEAVLARGYEVAAVVMFSDEFGNSESLPCLTPLPKERLFKIPLKLGSGVNLADPPRELRLVLRNLVKHLQLFRQNRIVRLSGMEERARASVWWPFTQHADVKSVSVIDSAFGSDFHVALQSDSGEWELRTELDASASWWTLGLGHGDQRLSQEIAAAAARYGHVLFPENAHEPAVELAEKLLQTVGRGFASRVFYSDNGSTAVEVALKMAFRTRERRIGRAGRSVSGHFHVLGLMDSYHGDTLAAMNATNANPFTDMEKWYCPTGCWLAFPRVAFASGRLQLNAESSVRFILQRQSQTLDSQGWPMRHFASLGEMYDTETRMQSDPELASAYLAIVEGVLGRLTELGVEVGALLLEPLVHGSAGMLFVDPLFQRILVEQSRRNGIPVIFDEVFSGFFRFGSGSAKELIGAVPDLACYSKMLTGGVVPLAATLASDEVFQGFFGGGKENCMLHGHSYTAHPVGCVAALTSLRRYEELSRSEERIQFFDFAWLCDLSRRDGVASVMGLGTVLAVTLQTEDAGYLSGSGQKLCEELATFGLNIRPLGHVLYVMLSPFASQKEVAKVKLAFEQVLGRSSRRE